MKLRFGYDMEYECVQPTPMIMTLNVHPSQVPDLEQPDHVNTEPAVPLSSYRDDFGNWVTRLVLPEGTTRVFSEAIINDDGEPDVTNRDAMQHAVENLPDEILVYLLGSRYCETDLLVDEAWKLFSSAPFGWQRVQSICDFVHQHINFGYDFARPTKTAAEAYKEKAGVCRDFTHLAITLCRCMNIPSRYCTGYIANIDNALNSDERDFAAWFEAYLDDQWYVFDPRNNKHVAGRILIARGRDAADVAISNAFGSNLLNKFEVFIGEVEE
ncbi:MAG: transglutaminase family protein [Pseudomonadales bacterium]|nr:transglutaminase family protein [Pseudomonadales bacterium]